MNRVAHRKLVYLIVLTLIVSGISFGQTTNSGTTLNQEKQSYKGIQNNSKMENKMKVEIWSDVMCPFCYIGKRKFETALEQFSNKDHIEIEWKSYQLMPELKAAPGKTINDILVETKGISLEQAKGMNAQVTQMAKQVGLEYNLEKSIPANTFNAHRFAHFAKTHNKQNQAEEALFKAYFTDSKDIGDISTLMQLGIEIGLDTEALKKALESEAYTGEVQKDIYEAQQVGVRGVPFFVLDRKYAVSGAQEPQAFLQALEKSFAEWESQNAGAKMEVTNGQVCTPQGNCD